MPVFRIDYNENDILPDDFDSFNDYLLNESVDIFNTPLEHMSLFAQAYGKHFYSPSLMEIYCNVESKKFNVEGKTVEEQHSKFVSELGAKIKAYKDKNGISKPILLTVTIQNWKFEWIE